MKKIILAALSVFLFLGGAVFAQEIDLNALISQTIETDNGFEIQGTVTAVNDSSFTIRGELIAVASEDMGRLKTNEIIKKGNFVRAEGKIENNIMVAEKITLLEKDFQEVPILSEEAGVDVKAEAQVQDEGLLKTILQAIKELFN